MSLSLFRKPIAASAWTACASLMLAGFVHAQTLTTLHSFSAPGTGKNTDGANPVGGLIIAGNTLYGTAAGGGSESNGTVFAINADGSGFTVLHTFSGFNNTSGFSDGNTNSDGAYPSANLILSGDTLYGTALGGGALGFGTVFALNTNGTGFTTLHDFANENDGSTPVAGLLLSGDTLYGTAEYGGSFGSGTVFSLGTDGSDFTTLHAFTGGVDGSTPNAELILAGSTLYSTTVYGGSASNGTVFAVNTNGAGFTVLHSFSVEVNGTNSDGGLPYAGLVLSSSGDILYGTATTGGATGPGTVFAVNTNGSGFTTLHHFSANPVLFNNDGALPYGTLVLSGDTLYGTAKFAGKHGVGTIFSVSTSGTDFTTLHSFVQDTDGAWAYDGLVLSDNALYGTANIGGAGDVGTIFKLSGGSIKSPPPPPTYLLKIESSPRQPIGDFGIIVYAPTGSVDQSAAVPIGATNFTTSVPAGDMVSISLLSSSSCYKFSHWTVDGKPTNVDNVLFVNGPETVVANFSLLDYAIETVVSPPKSGIAIGGGSKGCGSMATLTATAIAGFKFTNWTANGVIQSYKPKYTFPVSGAETFTANFADTAPPTVTITSPISGSKTTNATITLVGKAKDNVAVAEVYFRIGATGDWTQAQQTSAGWATWNAMAQLSAGANVIEVYAVDTSKNASVPVKVTITLKSKT